MKFRPLLSISLILSFCVSAFAQASDPLEIFDREKHWYHGPGAPWFYFFDIPEADVRRSIEKWLEIDSSLKSGGEGGRFWSGGSTHGTIMRWSKDKGYIWLDVDMCQGGPMRIVHGRVERTPIGLTLIPELKLGAGHSGHGGHASHPERMEFVSIEWRGETHLVGKNDLADFADYTAGLGDHSSRYPYTEHFPYLGDGGPEAVTPDQKIPRYPIGYEKFHKRPVRGSIVSIGKGRRVIDKESEHDDKLITPITIKLESGENFKPDLYMHLVDAGSEEIPDEFTLRSKRGNVAIVELIQPIPKKNCVASEHYNDCKPPAPPQLRKGQILSTNGF